jgi:hypothetical protein
MTSGRNRNWTVTRCPLCLPCVCFSLTIQR